MAYRTPDPKQLDLSQKESLLMRLSQHIEQAQVDSPAYFLSNLAQKGNEELVNEFLSDQPSVDASSLESFIQTQLYVSCFWGLYDIVKILIDNKADVNYKNTSTLWTPLHAATFQDQGRVIMILLEHGADPLSKDSKGRTPTDFASCSDKIWSHFDVLNIPRTPASALIKKKILRGIPGSSSVSSITSPEHQTKSGIKLASYSAASETKDRELDRKNMRSAISSHPRQNGYDSTSSLSQVSESTSTFSGKQNDLSPRTLNSSNSAAQSTILGREYGYTPTSSRSRSRKSVSDSSQMHGILNGVGDITLESPINTGRTRSYNSQRSSASMSSVLSWD